MANPPIDVEQYQRWMTTVARLTSAGAWRRGLLFCCVTWTLLGMHAPWVNARDPWGTDPIVIVGWMRVEGQFALLCTCLALGAAAWRVAGGTCMVGWSSLVLTALTLAPTLLLTVRLQIDVRYWSAAQGIHPVEGWAAFEPAWGLVWTLLAVNTAALLLCGEVWRQWRSARLVSLPTAH